LPITQIFIFELALPKKFFVGFKHSSCLLPAHAIETFAEGNGTALHDIADKLTSGFFLKSAGSISISLYLPSVVNHGVNKIRVSVDNDVGVVGHDDDLSMLLHGSDLLHDEGHDHPG